MKRILFIAAVLGAAGLVAASSASIRAPRHANQGAAVARGASTHSNGTCPGGCPLCDSKHGAAAHAGAAGVHAKPLSARGACPAADPAKCPSSCPREGAAASVASATR